MSRSYSEEFRWRDLRLRAEKMLDDLRSHWRATKTMPRIAYAWSGADVRDDQGSVVSGVVSLLLPDGDVTKIVRSLVDRTNASAFLLVDPSELDVKVLLESRQGTACWTMRFRRMADLVVLGAATCVDDAEGLRIFWKP